MLSFCLGGASLFKTSLTISKTKNVIECEWNGGLSFVSVHFSHFIFHFNYCVEIDLSWFIFQYRKYSLFLCYASIKTIRIVHHFKHWNVRSFSMKNTRNTSAPISRRTILEGDKNWIQVNTWTHSGISSTIFLIFAIELNWDPLTHIQIYVLASQFSVARRYV